MAWHVVESVLLLPGGVSLSELGASGDGFALVGVNPVGSVLSFRCGGRGVTLELSIGMVMIACVRV